MTNRRAGAIPVFEETESNSSHSRSSSSSRSSRIDAGVAAFFLYGAVGGQHGQLGHVRSEGSAADAAGGAVDAAHALQHRSEAMQRVGRFFRHRGALPFEQSAVLFPEAADVLVKGASEGGAFSEEENTTGDESITQRSATAKSDEEARRWRARDVPPTLFRNGGAGTTGLDLFAPSWRPAVAAAAASASPPPPRALSTLEREEAYMKEPAVAAAMSALAERNVNKSGKKSSASHTHVKRTTKTSRCPVSSAAPHKKSKKITSVMSAESTVGAATTTETSTPQDNVASSAAVAITVHDEDEAITAEPAADDSPASSAHAASMRRRVGSLLPTFSATEQRALFDDDSDSESGDRAQAGAAPPAVVAVGVGDDADAQRDLPLRFSSDEAAHQYFLRDMENKVGEAGVPALRSHLYFEQPNGVFVDRCTHNLLQEQRKELLALRRAHEEKEERQRQKRSRLYSGNRRFGVLGSGGGGGVGGTHVIDKGKTGTAHQSGVSADAPVQWESQREDALLYRINVLSLLRYLQRVYYFLSAFACGVAVLTLILATAPAFADSARWGVHDVVLGPAGSTATHAFPSRLALVVALLSVFDAPLFLFLTLALLVTGLSPFVWGIAEGQWINLRLEQIRCRLDADTACGMNAGTTGTAASERALAASLSDVLASGVASGTARREMSRNASCVASGMWSGKPNTRASMAWGGLSPRASSDAMASSARDPARPQRTSTSAPPRRASSMPLELSMPSLAQRRVSARASLLPLSDTNTRRGRTRGDAKGTGRSLSISMSRGVSVGGEQDDRRGVGGGASTYPVRALYENSARTAQPPLPASPFMTGLSSVRDATLGTCAVPAYYTQALSFVVDGTLHADNVFTRIFEDTQRRVVACCFGRSWTAQSFWVLVQPRHWCCLVSLALTIVELAMVHEQDSDTLLFAEDEGATREQTTPVTVVFAIICTRAALFIIIWLLNVFF